ncbi:MAG TPA: hypothetical protein D7H83_00570 [Candidatus Poseidoniales archaeon]|jgi:hypothetical protein|nr:hypothetical protein [Candidatus Poseidoniaceae archaeon]DAC41723.1 MAG TPA: hypothetical protein D7H83_00570 [Candidatus Poseidoniales archaeon]HIH56861.1 hypothetical protein [Candidatus Poseidoniaceae archaeon]|tara:strand:+ start:257 stop:1108 length:852 start_codon:yes stop_codon:yes gene_type:complete
MVDISTAMAAAAGERRNRGTGDKERKKNRSGADMGIESFDPVKHVSKEKADTISMWLVISFAATMSLLMRYVAMPSAQDNADMLWFIPMMGIFLLPSIHRAILPEKFVEHYTKGTWFKASFLHIFTWLALTFLLTNAPFADIVAPEVDDGWGMITSTEEGYDFTKSSKGEVTLTEGYTGTHFIVLSFTDNFDASDAKYTITFNGDSANNSWQDIESSDASALDSVRSHKDIDYPVAIAVPEGLTEGSYDFVIKVTEDGDPWENTRTVTMTLVIDELVEEDSTE